MADIYHDNWSSLEDMCNSFEIQTSELDGAEVLYARYSYESYEGDAFVLFRKDGKLYEVVGGHCSCYGLEGQWDPEETTLDALKARNYPESIADAIAAAS